jgi:DNA-directed RNA polymerase subunit RPC12/RpoP
MSTYKCPKGHVSTEADYCSECGAKINGMVNQAIASGTIGFTVAVKSDAIACPECGATHEADSGNFCEICGYNFATKAHGEVPILLSPSHNIVDSKTSISQALISNPDSAQTNRQTDIILEVIITIDPLLRCQDSPPAPTNQPPIIIKLDKSSNLIGRHSEIRGIHPEIALNFDDAVSHRHALLIQQPDGSLILRDIGSSNGTKLNNVELQSMVDVPIKDGDELTLGHWTRLKLRVNS